MSDNTGISWTDATWSRFWANVTKTATCWLWSAGKFSSGYGQFRVGRLKVRAHRAAYDRLVGPIHPDKMLCHRCDTPACVNPAHLFVGTALDNARDRDSKGRGATPPRTAMHGDSNPAARLSAADVQEIRAAAGRETQRSIATRYGVAQTTISSIIRGATWGTDGR